MAGVDVRKFLLDLAGAGELVEGFIKEKWILFFKVLRSVCSIVWLFVTISLS